MTKNRIGENTMTAEMLRHIERLIEQRPAPRKILETYRHLIKEVMDTGTVETDFDIQVDRAAAMLKEGFPLFRRRDLPINQESASARLSKCLEHLARQDRGDREALQTAMKKAKTDSKWCEKVFTAVLGEDEPLLNGVAGDVGLDSGVMLFLAKVSLAPSMKAIQSAVDGQLDKKEWEQGFCPVCGSGPNMAYFTAQGTRYLHCELCGDEWRYPRMKCPFCENEDHDTLGYFQADEEEGFRVYFCRKCKRYIKTVDKAVFEESAPMDLEYMATLHLDLAADERGFN
jgi:FdhE protein